ncbi:hypothetical protein [uncultured Gemmiger sp.]|uniref:hypothetical protein n=1 Tax=uncultured Gemmiger sp. TaxID=1623490 RepID=UPI0025D0898D|nr:hypothetical protein [uncultured Gemmiger sp.]
MSNRFQAVGLFCWALWGEFPLPYRPILQFFGGNFNFFPLFSECFPFPRRLRADLLHGQRCSLHPFFPKILRAIPHNSKCRYGERGAAAAGAVLKPQSGNYAVLP